MNNEPVAWFEQDPDMKSVWYQADKDAPNAIPLYTHPADLTDEIEDLKNELMMEEESYMLLNESFLFAKESIKQQQIKIKELETKTLTDEKIEVYKEALEKLARLGNGDEYGNSIGNDIAIDALRKAQE